MNKSAFLELLKKVSNISDQHTEELEKVAAAFPYCQTAHLLLAKSAFDQGSMLSAQRLRKASSYATNRQVLKRIIYSAPVIEPAFVIEENEPEPEEWQPTTSLIHIPATEKSLSEESEEHLHQPETKYPAYTPADFVEDLKHSSSETYTTEASGQHHDFDSELAMLLTLNSLSPSSTDLLAKEASLLLSEANSSAPVVDDDTQAAATDPEDFLTEESEVADALSESAVLHPSDLEEEPFYEDDEPMTVPSAEESPVVYSSSEIDRLYLEDALGYWMGSSRMGEVLQVKDDYTRLKPHGFHPELILEYSKTHELEKAVQPDTNLLSKELDIIDQFLKLNPRLKTMANFRVKAEPQEDLSLKSTKIKKGIASESLANIFLKQGKVKKAVKIYEQLILKYPEKKVYFAEQIEKLQNLT